jgi:protein O-mannosyl-transferase
LLCATLLVTSLVYLRCLGNEFVWDDQGLILQNHYLGQWSFIWKSLINGLYWFLPSGLRSVQSPRYRPLLSIAFALDYHLFGLDPIGWHATGVVVHLIAVYLVFKIAFRLTAARESALLAALLFALIPINAETVVWPTALGISLSAVFELAALYFFIERNAASVRNWTLALLLFALALLGHEMAAAFPALIGFYVLFLEVTGDGAASPSPRQEMAQPFAHAMLCAAPFAAEVLLYLVVRHLVLGFALLNPAHVINHATTAQILLTVPRVILAYVMLIAVPWMAGPAHRVIFVTRIASPDFLLPVIILISIAGALFATLRKHPQRRFYLFCAAWVASQIAPRMYLYAFNESNLVHDSYLYMASVGWCLLAADVVVGFARQGAPLRRNLTWATVAAISLGYAVGVWNLEPLWHDDLSLFSACVRIFPDSAFYHFSLAQALKRAGDLARAEQEFNESYKLEPGPDKLLELGKLHVAAGQLRQGIAEMANALAHEADPVPDDYMVLAELYDTLGEHTQSEAAITRAESLPGGAEVAALAHAQIATQHGQAQQAEAIARGLTHRYPGDYRVWLQLGLALSAQNRASDALSSFDQALRLAPYDSILHVVAGAMLHKLGRDREALDQCRVALALHPDEPNARALTAEILGRRSSR